jgi:hypothetical protein
MTRPKSLNRSLAISAQRRCDVSGIHSAISADGNWNVRGMTPTIRQDAPLISSDWPSAATDAPNRRVHRPWLMTRLGSRRSSSSAANARPTAGATPSTEKRLGETRAASTRIGSSSPVSVTGLRRLLIAISTNERLMVRQSSKFG